MGAWRQTIVGDAPAELRDAPTGPRRIGGVVEEKGFRRFFDVSLGLHEEMVGVGARGV